MNDKDVKRNIKAIDNLLRKKFDLGFLLDAVEKQKEAHEKPFIYWLPIVDLLRFIPDFEKEVKRFREKNKISPPKLNKELKNLLGKEKYLLYIHNHKKFARGLALLGISEVERKGWLEIKNKIETWEMKKFPTILKEVGMLRLLVFEKLPSVWHEAIKDYILYNKIDISLVAFRKSTPKTNIKVEAKTLEPYIELRVYTNTNLAVFKKIDWLRKMQKQLPNYFDPDKFDEETLLRRFFYFVIRKHLGLDHKRANEWLREKGLREFDYQYASQEIERFLKLFRKPFK